MSLPVEIFNGPVEVGTRIALILVNIEHIELNLDQLAFFDYVLIYSKEFNGVANVHPPLPNHFAEIIKRRETLPATLAYFISKGIITTSIGSDGIKYKATDKAIYYTSALKSSYYKKLIQNLSWIENNIDELLEKQKNLFSTRVRYR